MKNCISYVAIVISFAATLFPTVTCVRHPADIPKTNAAPELERHDARSRSSVGAEKSRYIGSPLAWAASIVASMFGGGAARRPD